MLLLLCSAICDACAMDTRFLQPFAYTVSLRSGRRRAFSLVELLVVLAIVSLLASLLFPVFMTVRGKARQTVCLSNLRQIGLGISMYAQDYDGLYPFALDPSDKYIPEIWGSQPEFQAQISTTGMIQDVLQPYVNSKTLFRCPADSGFDMADFAVRPLKARPTSYEAFGTSYYYRTEIAARHAGDFTFQFPSQINVLFDGAGHWHGTLVPLAPRYNVLFADGHVKNLTREQISRAWATPLQGS